MKTDKNTWRGFFFFLLRLISVVAVVIGMFFAYEYYKSYRLNNNLNVIYDVLKDYSSH